MQGLPPPTPSPRRLRHQPQPRTPPAGPPTPRRVPALPAAGPPAAGPDTATAKVWDQARGRALAEISRRHRAEWHQHYRQVRAANPTWSGAQASNAATSQQRRAHHPEYLALLRGYAGARRAGPRLVAKLARRAQRLLQLAHPAEYQALYAAERAKLATPTQQRPAPPQQGGPAG
jgi:hypothetical protein